MKISEEPNEVKLELIAPGLKSTVLVNRPTIDNSFPAISISATMSSPLPPILLAQTKAPLESILVK